MTGREKLLRDAIEAVKARGQTYGPPREHFDRTCKAANALMPDLFAREMLPSDWAKLMLIDKVSRDAEKSILDNCIDIAGYAACLAEIRHIGDNVAQQPQADIYASCDLVGEDEG